MVTVLSYFWMQEKVWKLGIENRGWRYEKNTLILAVTASHIVLMVDVLIVALSYYLYS